MLSDFVSMGLKKSVEALPESLKEQLTNLVVSGHELSKCWTMAIVAKHLVDLGYSGVSFKRLLTARDGMRFYVDVYCEEPRLHVICIADSASLWVESRIRRIREIDHQAKVAVVVQDWFAWPASEHEIGADEVLVATMNGEVLKLSDWQEKRRKELEEIAVSYARDLHMLLEYYERIKKIYDEDRASRRSFCHLLITRLTDLAQALGVKSPDWLREGKYRLERDRTLDDLLRERMLVHVEILKSFADFSNKILGLCAPFRLYVTEDGTMFIHSDPEAEVWLNWNSDKFVIDGTLTIKKELEIIANTIEKARSEGKIPPKKTYTLFHFITRKEASPPQIISVPREALVDILKKIEKIEKTLEKLEDKL